MRVFVAGASGVIGQPLVRALIDAGHVVNGMTQSARGVERLAAMGATGTIADAFDHAAILAALKAFQPEIVIDELTALPKSPADMPQAARHDRELRLIGGGNLHRTAEFSGVRRYLQQSSGFFLDCTGRIGDESTPLATNGSPGVAEAAEAYTQLEARVLNSSMEGVALRYGFFYGPGTWYHPDGAAADLARKRQLPIIGAGNGVSSFVHIEDAAHATVAAIASAPGIYNIVDDDPSPVAVWLPAFAKFVGAPPPPHVTEEGGREQFGEDAVYRATQLAGASNEKAKRDLGFRPRRLEWLSVPR